MGEIPPEVREGAKNLVDGVAAAGEKGLSEGDEVLILNETTDRVEDDVTKALASALRDHSVEVLVLETKELPKGWMDTPPEIVVDAWKSADFCIYNHYTINRAHSSIHNAIYGEYEDAEATTSVRNYATTNKLLGSDWGTFPLEIYNKIDEIMIEKFKHADGFRMTDPLGTDVSGSIVGYKAEVDGLVDELNVRMEDEVNRNFPPGTMSPVQVADCEGKIVFNSPIPWSSRLWGLGDLVLDAPIEFTVEDNQAVDISGPGPVEAVEYGYQQIHEEANVPKDELYNIDSFHFGLGPKAHTHVGERDPDWSWHLMHHSPRLAHFHVGGDPHKDYGADVSGEHVSTGSYNATIELDGEAIIDEGEITFLDDSEIMEIAKKYGDVEEILSHRSLDPHIKSALDRQSR